MANTTQVEVESKFDVDESFKLPDLLTLPSVTAVEPPVEYALEATYFDTADLRLLNSRITLRRRTGGQDAGWHLKLPAVGSARLEVREPVGPAERTVPPKLSSLVRVRVRSEALVPVAQLSTRRVVHRLLGENDVVLAEVSDDTVVAMTMATEPGEAVTAMTFREVEVELVDGSEALLLEADPVLRAAGARPGASPAKLAKVLESKAAALRAAAASAGAAGGKAKSKKGKKAGPTAGQAAMAYVAAQVEELQSWDPHVRVDEEDAVHKMRVSARRLRSALATDRPLLDRAVTDPIRDELRWLGVVLGGARDAEVMHERLCKDVNRLPAELVVGPVIARIDTELRKRYRKAHDEVLVELNGQRYLSLVDALDNLVTDPPLTKRAKRPARREIEYVVLRTRRRVERAVEALDNASDPVERDHLLHEVRKAAKRARYAGESVVDLFGEHASDFAETMEGFQEILGTHQDSVVAREELRAMGMRAHLAGENGFTFGLLYGKQMAYAEDDERNFRKAWTDAGTHMRWP